MKGLDIEIAIRNALAPPIKCTIGLGGASFITFDRLHQGKQQYLVRWDGYPKEEASWVNEEDLQKQLLSEFLVSLVQALYMYNHVVI